MNNRHIITFLILIILAAWPQAFAAGNADDLLNKVVDTYRSSGGITAHYLITTDQGQTEGQITMQGEKFRMLSPDLKCWFNGKTQWSYSPVSEEVNIMEPTAEELSMINPYSIISNFRNAYTTKLLKSATAGNDELEMLPVSKKGSDILSVRLTINKRNNLPVKIIFVLNDGSSIIVSLNNYKTGARYTDDMFTFDKALVPPQTPIVDLR